MQENESMRFNIVRPKVIGFKEKPNLDVKILPLNQDLLDKISHITESKAGKILDGLSKEIAHVFGADVNLPTVSKQIAQNFESYVERYIPKTASDITLSLYMSILNRFPFLAPDPIEREMISAHMLSIMINESRLNPKAIVVENGKVAAYGFMQHRRSNWMTHCANFSSSPYGKALLSTGVIAGVSSSLNVPQDHLTNPFDKYGPDFMTVYQLIPMLGQTFALRKALLDKFVYTGGSWYPKSDRYAQSPLWDYLRTKYKKLLGTYEGGKQMLMTLMHTQGTDFLKKSMIDKWAEERIVKDARTFAALLVNPMMRDYIRKGLANWSEVNNMFGDPHDDKPKVLKSKTGRSKYSTDWHTKSKRDTSVEVTSRFNPKRAPVKVGTDKEGNAVYSPEGHFGIDIRAKYVPVYSLGPGFITNFGSELTKSGRGRWIEITHTEGNQKGWKTRYYHLNEHLVSPKTSLGSATQVELGTKLGISGMTGSAGTPHLHLEIIDPQGVNRNPDSFDVPFDYNEAV